MRKYQQRRGISRTGAIVLLSLVGLSGIVAVVLPTFFG